MKESGHLLVFQIESERLALNLEYIQRIERAVEIKKIPDLPPLIKGIIDYHGTIVPVYDLRKKLGYTSKETLASWRFLVVKTMNRLLVVVADQVEGVITNPSGTITPGSQLENNIIQPDFLRQDDGLILIYDVDRFLTQTDEEILEKSLYSHTQPDPAQ